MYTPDVAYFLFSVSLYFLVGRITHRTSARSASALPTKATPPLPLAVGESPETPFSTKKVKTGGGKSQKSKGFFWWCAARLAVLGFGGLSLYGSAITSEIGSSERKKSLHFRQNSNLVAHSGGFLLNRAWNIDDNL